jgi:hypothetical protein
MVLFYISYMFTFNCRLYELWYHCRLYLWRIFVRFFIYLLFITMHFYHYIAGYDNEREQEQRYTYKDESMQSSPTNPNNHRQNYFKPMGLRNNYLSGQSPSTSHINTVTPAPINSRNQPLPIHSKYLINNTFNPYK